MTNEDRDRPNANSIDENLRKVYEETIQEGIPDRFKNLLEQLREQEKADETARKEKRG